VVYLEYVTEHTAWGILGADAKWGEIISSKLDLKGFWNLIVDHAPTDLKQELKDLRKLINDAADDRNVIVHGQVHAVMMVGGDKLKDRQIYDIIGVEDVHSFAVPPSWVVHKGPNAGKCFPISTRAVEIVDENVYQIGLRVQNFNKRFGHYKGRVPSDEIATDWPKPLEE
jgi:hypothetical protein